MGNYQDNSSAIWEIIDGVSDIFQEEKNLEKDDEKISVSYCLKLNLKIQKRIAGISN